MPTTPPTDGLPVALQILVTLIFGVVALAIAFKGYFTKGERPAVSAAEPQTAALLAATIMDTGAVRHLSDVCIRLTGAVDKLTDAMEENTHHKRNGIELEREICARLRELREELERHRG